MKKKLAAIFSTIGIPLILVCLSIVFSTSNVLYFGRTLANAGSSLSGKYEIKAKTKKIGNEAFEYCYKMTEVTIPDNVVTIGDGAFSKCTALDVVTFGNNMKLEAIGEEAFFNCGNLSKVFIGDVAAWCDVSFGSATANPIYFANDLYLNGQLVTKLEIPQGVTSIKDYAFYNSSLTELAIAESVASIGNAAFNGCNNLTTVVMPKNVTSLGNEAFARCANLTSVAFGENSQLTTIGDSAFSGCNALAEITIPKGVTTIGDKVFESCKSIANINVDENNTQYKSIDGNLYSKDGKTLIQYAVGKMDAVFTVPDGVTTINSNAFSGCRSLTKIVLPNTVTTIGERAFSSCVSLREMIIPASVTTMGAYMFSASEKVEVYCEATSQPSGWHNTYSSDRPIYFYSESKPTAKGKYWHYVNEKIKKW